MEEDRLPLEPQGTTITRLNYNRPKWFGGFFGDPDKHNKPGNCRYDADAMARILTPEDLNRLVEPLYMLTPVLAYHMAITIFIALSIFLTVLQQGFNALIQFAFITSFDSNNGYLRVLGVIWYCVWGIGLFTIIPLYYVSIHHIERYFRECSDPVFEELHVKTNIKKTVSNKFLLIEGFQKLQSIEIVSA